MTIDIGRVGIWAASFVWAKAGSDTGTVAAELDELGYGTTWVGNEGGDLNVVSAVLDGSRRMTVASGIVNIWNNPAGALATRYAEIAAQHPNRALLGIGNSHAPAVDPTSGTRYEKPFSKTVDYLDQLDAAALPTENRILAALGPKMLALAGQRSLGAHPFLTTPDHTATAREILGEGPLLAPEQKVVLETDPAKARAIARGNIAYYLALPNYTNNLLRLGFTADDFGNGGSDRLVDYLVAWGDADTIRKRVHEHLDAGADHVAVAVLIEGMVHATPDSWQLPRAQWRELAPALLD
ncbi:LLM class F420-dependent oxidoreductase [Nocardia sp. NPDC051030]|uniref:LLM class F420-dependent oxidoreductase n=1 Tax=Nocardia sp. NPDC051030 TaxID=3155162 RepID=UPI00341E370E